MVLRLIKSINPEKNNSPMHASPDTFAQVRVLIVPGLYGSGKGHWQTRWQDLYPEFVWVAQERADLPDLDAWSARLDQVLQESDQATLIAAHSFGCLATVHRASLGAPNVIGALLVAPAAPTRFGLQDRLQNIVLPMPSIMLASRNDPWMNFSQAKNLASNWQAEFIDLGLLGHINADSGLGDWPFGLSQLQRLAALSTCQA